MADYTEETSAFAAFRPPNFANCVWIFVVGCIIGTILEFVYCILVHERIESRQSLIYGPFNVVYGIGILAMLLTAVPASKYGSIIVFLVSALTGGLVEYNCSLFQETVFGTKSWDFSKKMWDLDGRTSFKFMVFWGILGVLFAKWIYPFIMKHMKKARFTNNKVLASLIVIFFVVNSLISALAVNRWVQRTNGYPAQNSVETHFDQKYDDELMEFVYPNMKKVKKDDG